MYSKIISLLLFLLVANLSTFSQEPNPYLPDNQSPTILPSMNLVWSDEFNIDGKPNAAFWKYENGFVRNEELQWYQPDNASCKNGLLVIEARRERKLNPNYVAGSTNWKTNRQYAEYTSACIKSPGLVNYQFGRIEVRARINVSQGSWPAIWTLGENGEWPSSGEIDMMEFYRKAGVPSILANVAWGTSTRWSAKWDSAVKPLSYFLGKDANWADKFHIWRMDWNKDSICLYLDNEMLNYTLLNQTINAAGVSPVNPFLQKHYFLLNLAIGSNGGDPSPTAFPLKYEVDYIRVYQPSTTSVMNNILQNTNEMLIFPNPGNDKITLSLNTLHLPTNVSIYNLNGIKLLEWNVTNKSTQLAVEKLIAGVYCLNVTTPHGSINQKFVVQ